MPKLIPQLKEEILKTAEELFVRDGFDGVSMRRLAESLDIAVGTLYNYFPNKTGLFYSIMELSWENTFSEIRKLIDNPGARTPAVRRAAVEAIYRGIEARGAFTLKAFKPAEAEKETHNIKHHDTHWQKALIRRLTNTLSPLGAGFSGREAERLVMTLLASIRFFILSAESAEREKDIDYLMKIIEETR